MNKKKILILVGMIVVFLGVRYFNVDATISVESLLDNKERFIAFSSKYYILSVIIYLVLNIVLGAIGVPVYGVFTMAAGLMFGFLEGLVFSMSAAVLGGYISFNLSRYAFRDFFHKRYSHRLDKFERRLEGREFAHLLGLRLLPGFPYFITNIIAGLSPIKVSPFFMSTIIGILPSAILFNYTGHVLRELDSMAQMMTMKYLWPVIAVALMTLVAIILRLKKNKVI
ncbi:TVP38/TMEM64 family protein [Acidaminobacter sp. JC074]|uniref:TVP38/TMEM64 family protein n=1 Tax=Acidaminobacter sp. JC074 TaxID=2530199 RepID=UPI001F10B5C0|nr:VTT domain-containing protein [Acidaminobacter sp. JC074]MCH4889668.1 TVP38/TMEM64 family protein [Acidaminobacter sp. JC074]